LEKIHYFLEKYYRLILGIFFALLICLNMLIYYQFVYLVMKARPDLTSEEVTIDQENLGKVLDNLDQRQENLKRIEHASYPDPFR